MPTREAERRPATSRFLRDGKGGLAVAGAVCNMVASKSPENKTDIASWPARLAGIFGGRSARRP